MANRFQSLIDGTSNQRDNTFTPSNGNRFSNLMEPSPVENTQPKPAHQAPAPAQQPQPINKPSFIGNILSGLKQYVTHPEQLVNEIGLGLGHGLSNMSTVKQNEDVANLLLKNTLPGMSDIGKRELSSIQKNKDYLQAHPVTTIPGMIGEQIPQIPLWLSGEGAINLAGKGVAKLAPSFMEKASVKLPGIIKGGLKDAATFGTIVAPTETIANGDGLQGLLQREKQLPGVFLGGTAFRGVGKVAGKSLEGVKGVLKPHGVPTTPFESSPLNNLSPREQISALSIQNPTLEGPLSSSKVREQTLKDVAAKFNLTTDVFLRRIRNGYKSPMNKELVTAYNNFISKGSRQEHPITTIQPQNIPEQVLPTQPEVITQQANLSQNTLNNQIPKERQFAQNVRDSQVAPESVKQNTIDNRMTYEPITNKETLNKANSIVESDAKKAQELFGAPSKGINADDVALGESLIVKAIKDGDTEGANKLIADLASKLTTAGQAVQAASIFKRLTPEGMLLYAQRVVNGANKDLLARLGTKAKKIELTPEDSQFIIDTMQRAQGLPDGREKDVALAQISKLISEKVPSTLSDKVMALQRISLLLNPKTMVRNVLGNIVFGAVDNASNAVATPIDAITSKLLKSDRTTTMPSITGQLKSMAEGAKITAQDAKLGIDTYHNKTQYEFSGKRVFAGKDPLNKTLNKLDKATITGLKMGDTPFHKAAYDDSLRQQMKLAKTDAPTTKMLEQAQKTADQRTYQDVNDLTKGFKMAQQALNKVSSGIGIGNSEFGLGNIVMPFVKTPANILKRAIEYSPAGLTTALKEATNISKGTFNQKAFVDSISRSVTGTALIMVGYDLARKGIITGSGNKDADVAAFERGLGKNDYAFKVGDKYFTYDWMQPASMAMAIGADIAIKGKDRKQAENVVVDAVKSGGETLFKQSLLQGVTRFMSGYSPMDNLATTAINAPNQFIPTFGKQISQLIDPTQRVTTSPTNLGTELNLLKSRIPGLTKTLQPKINTSGETMQAFQGNNNPFNIFINPGSYTTYAPNDVQKGILKVYESTGDKNVFPKLAPKSFTEKGKTIQLTPEEITTFQQGMGKDTEARMRSILHGSMADTLKAKALEDAISKAYDKAKDNLLRSRKK